jgi:eukaryotic-like serine/threonine-protein kinase
MSINSIDTLLAVLRRTMLLAPEQADEVARELVPHFADPKALGEYLVEIDWLTAFQLQLLLAGDWDELTVGPYQVLDRLGEGGVSEVFKAWDTLRGRTVALKVLRQHLAVNSDVVRQFRRELGAITRLAHPNIIKTFDAHQEGRTHYFAMEFVEGMDLGRYVAEVGPLPVEQACDYARQAAQGLQHAHQSGLVHRDIKPANLFLLHPPLPAPPGSPSRRGPDPVVKILDWGLARCLGAGGEQAPPAEAFLWGLEAEKGSLVGTADYIAPEQASDPTLVDIRADLYSLGCTLYFLLTGHPPFHGSSLMQKLLQHRESPPPSLKPERPDVPDELDALVLRMLAKAPEDRPQIPLLVVTPLRRFCTAPAASARPGALASSGNLLRPGGTPPGTAINLPRPATHATLARPSTQGHLSRPGETAINLPRPGPNGHGNGHLGR